MILGLSSFRLLQQWTIPSMTSLVELVDITKVSVLNADSKTVVASIFGTTPGQLRSDPDVDHQLILVVPFRTKVKLQAIKLSAESVDNGPKVVKIWVDQPNITFADADKTAPTDTLSLAAKVTLCCFFVA